MGTESMPKKMGKGVLSDMMEGANLRKSLKMRGIEALKGVGGRIARGGASKRSRRVNKRGRVCKKKKCKSKRRKKAIRRNIVKACYKNDIFTPGL